PKSRPPATGMSRSGAGFELSGVSGSGGTIPRRAAFAFFGRVSLSVLYDNDRCRVSRNQPGVIVEHGAPKEFFANPRDERTKAFLSQIL
ncbi:MAG TPA: hypothetical protein VMM55_11805, partial [Thermohalobaculum sp.]|nr:hypothetical protein [Thermohalobaculum sp.]